MPCEHLMRYQSVSDAVVVIGFLSFVVLVFAVLIGACRNDISND
jgi:hypothetical protein